MVNLLERDGKKIYRCSICALGYIDKETAQRCENFCRDHKSCSLEITRNAILK